MSRAALWRAGKFWGGNFTFSSGCLSNVRVEKYGQNVKNTSVCLKIFVVNNHKCKQKSRQTQEIVKFQTTNYPADKEEMQ